MKLIRSFPREIPAGRNYIVDDAENIINWDYDYAGLADIPDDVIHLDWDTAISREDLISFAALVRANPDRVLIPPVLVYPDNVPGLAGPVWNCKKFAGPWLRYVEPGEADCDQFGFGILYIPRKMILEFAATGGKYGPFQDVAFATWHYDTYGPAALTWDIRPIHLHYWISKVPL